MWPGVVVVLDVLGENADEVPFAADQEPVQHSERALDTHRSAYAFAFGAAIGVRMIAMPSAVSTLSKSATNLVSRSRMRNRGARPSSASDIDSSRACRVIHGPLGWPVTPARRTRRVPTS